MTVTRFVTSHRSLIAALPERTSAISIIFPTGYDDDERAGFDGFAHLREHWALERLERVLSPARIVRRSAKTLRSATEFTMLVTGETHVDPRGVLEKMLGPGEFDRRREIATIRDEIRTARANRPGVIIDELLPIMLGWSSGWGYGDADRLEDLGAADFHARIAESWSSATPVISTGNDDCARSLGRAAAFGSASPAAKSIVPSWTGHTPTTGRYTTAAVGWVIEYEAPEWIEVVGDCVEYLNSLAAVEFHREFPDITVNFRLGQFDERFTSAHSDIVVAWFTTRGRPADPAEISENVRAALRIGRSALEDGRVDSERLAMRKRVTAMCTSSDPVQRAGWSARAALTGLAHAPCHDDPQSIRFSEQSRVARVLRALESANFPVVGDAR